MIDVKKTIQAKCFHPMAAMDATAVKGDIMKGGITTFEIFLTCKICGKNMVMVSRGHVATPEERGEVEAKGGTGKGIGG